MEETNFKKKILDDLEEQGIHPKIDTVQCVIHYTENGCCDGCDSAEECMKVFEAMADLVLRFLQGGVEDLDND